jgi:GTP-binding protein
LLLHIVDLARSTRRRPRPRCPDHRRELEKYDPELASKPRWLVLNKLDLIPEEEREQRIADFCRPARPSMTGPRASASARSAATVAAS